MKENLETIKWILKSNKKFIPAIIVIAIISIVLSYMGVYYSLVTKDVIDAAVGGTKDEFIRTIVIMIVYIIAMTVLGLISKLIGRTTGFRMESYWKQKLMDYILYGNYEQVSKYHSGELFSRMHSDLGTTNGGVLGFFPGILATLTSLITAIVIMGKLEPTMTIVICIGGIAVVFGSTMLRNRLKELHKLVQEAGAKLSSFLQEAIERVFMIQALDVGKAIETKEKGLIRNKIAAQIKQRNLGMVASIGLRTICIVAEFAVLLYCIVKLRRGLITFGTMTAMIQLFNKLEGPFVSFSSIIPSYISMIGSAERVRVITDFERDYPEEVDANKVYAAMESLSGENIWFRYRDRNDVPYEYIIRDYSFDIKKDSFCAVTGHSGIGKSTLLKLILGVCKPSEGELSIHEGDNDKVIVSRATRNLFSYVPQGNILMSGTIRDNIILARPSASEEEIKEAIDIADMNSFVDGLPEGIETKIGENGLGISEGQAQRVSIARAIISGKPIIMLDEATSSLDEETEAHVLERLKALPNRTIIAVTHRPAAMKLADSVIQL